MMKRTLDASDYTIIAGMLTAWLTSAAIIAGEADSSVRLSSGVSVAIDNWCLCRSNIRHR